MVNKMFVYEENVEKILIKLAEEFNGEELDLFTLRFRNIENNSITKVFYNNKKQTVDISTVLHHSVQAIERTIHATCERNDIFTIFDEKEVANVLEDLFFQVKYLVLRKIQNNPPKFDFVKEENESTEDYSTFYNKIPYMNVEFDDLDKKIRETFNQSFNLIRDYNFDLGEHIIFSVNLFKVRTEIERKLLKIRQCIWSAQFYFMSKGRFAEDQKHRYKKYIQEGIKLFDEFKFEYPQIDTTSLTTLFGLFKEES